jgi:putative membrane protein insertion efficiency factor
MNKLLKKIIIAIIELYQKTLSPDHGLFKSKFSHGYCKFYPTCSQYSKESFKKFGLIKALILTIKRLGRCHPWANPQIDLVPNS